MGMDMDMGLGDTGLRFRMRVICPKCGRVGILYIGSRNGYDYYYVAHGSRTRHYIGPFWRVNIRDIKQVPGEIKRGRKPINPKIVCPKCGETAYLRIKDDHGKKCYYARHSNRKEHYIGRVDRVNIDQFLQKHV